MHTNCCPKSLISGASRYYLDVFSVWKRLGGGDVWSLEAKLAEAILLLEEEWQKERDNAETEDNQKQQNSIKRFDEPGLRVYQRK